MYQLLSFVATTALLCVVYWFGLAVYRLYYHPLAKFPGPKYAALSRWHECYYDVYRQGSFIFWIEEQHKRYGPIIRINPDELHVLDVDFWENLFTTKAGRVDKYDKMSHRFGNDTSVLATATDKVHRVRRTALNPFFSRQRIVDLQDGIRTKLDLFLKQVQQYKQTELPMSIDRGYMAFSEDVIMRYCFGHDYNSIEKPGWKPILHDPFIGVCITGNTALQFPILPRVFNALPHSWLEKVEPLYALIFQMQDDFGRQIRDVKKGKTNGDNPKAEHQTVFSELIHGDLPPHEKADRRLQDGAQIIISAGFETTAWALSVATFYILRNPKVLARLRAELKQAIPEYDPTALSAKLEWTGLENLPYLTAVIKESLRLSYGTTLRNVRLLPKSIQYKDWLVPARTPISMTIPHLNHDEEVFPDSRSFVPERWLDSPKTSNGSSLERYFYSFGKGTRSCLGQNLAWCELYLTLAALFRFFEFELYETDESDVQLKHDFFLPFPKLDSKGVRVFVK